LSAWLLRLLETLVDRRQWGHRPLPAVCSHLGCADVALLAVVERQSEDVAEGDERALGRVGLRRLDAILDGVADRGA
jgi:hypothetical protein